MRAIIEHVSTSGIENLVVGAPSRNSFMRYYYSIYILLFFLLSDFCNNMSEYKSCHHHVWVDDSKQICQQLCQNQLQTSAMFMSFQKERLLQWEMQLVLLLLKAQWSHLNMKISSLLLLQTIATLQLVHHLGQANQLKQTLQGSNITDVLWFVYSKRFRDLCSVFFFVGHR